MATMAWLAAAAKPTRSLAVAAAPRMQRDAAAAGAMGIDDRIDRAVDLRLRQRVDDDLALPGLIGIGCQCWIAQPPQRVK